MPPIDDASRALDQSLDEERQAVTAGIVKRESPPAPTVADPFAAASSAPSEAPAATPAPTPTPEPKASPEGSSEASGATEGEDGPGVLGTMADMAKDSLRGPFREMADMVDNLGLASNALLEDYNPAFAVFGLHAGNRPGPGQSMNEVADPTVRQAFDEKFGTPETLLGGLAGGVSGQLAYIIPVGRALKALGVTSALRRGTAASAVVAGATTGQREGNLSEFASTEGAGNPLFDNVVTRFLATDADDTIWERQLKVMVEDIGLSFVGDAAVDVLKVGFKKAREGLKQVPTIETAAGRVRIDGSPEIKTAAEEVLGLKAQKDLVDLTIMNTKKGAKAISDTAGFREGAEAAGDVFDDAVEAVGQQADDMLLQRQQALTDAIADAEQRLIEAVELNELDGRYIEAYRQTVKGSVSKEVDAALGAAATRNMPDRVAPPETEMMGNFLEVNKGTTESVLAAWKSGDIAGLREAYGEVYDNTLYKNISEEGGIARLIEANSNVYGNAAASPRVQVEMGLIESGANATATLERKLAEAGGNIDIFHKGVREMAGRDVPLSELDTWFNNVRMNEQFAAFRLGKLLDDFEKFGYSDELAVEALKWHEVSAHLTEIRSGASSRIGRSLGNHRLKFEIEEFDSLLDADRASRATEVSAHIIEQGGSMRMRKSLEALLHAKKAGGDRLLDVNAKLVGAKTLQDVAYESFILNILSSPTTQAINVSSNAFRSMLFDPSLKLFEAGNRAVLEGDLKGFREFGSHISGLIDGMLGAFRYNALIDNTPLKEAWQRGRRLTGRGRGILQEQIPEQSSMSTGGLANLVRDGVPVTRNREVLGNRQLKLINKAQTREGLANWIEGRTGVVARGLNAVGGAMQWSGKSLAVGDELFAGMAKRAQLYADTTAKALDEGLTGQALSDRIDQLRRDVSNLPLLKNRASGADAVQNAYLKQLDELDLASTKYAERATFTTPSKTAAAFETFRQNVPGVRWFAPFVRTPLVLMEQGIKDFSPLGPLARVVKNELGDAPSTKEIAKVRAQVQLIGGVYALVWQLNADGVMTGGGPHNSDQRNIWRKANKPYSLKLRDKWYATDRYDPIAMPVNVLNDILYLQGRADQGLVDNLHQEAMGILYQAVKDGTFLQGLSELEAIARTQSGDMLQRAVVSRVHNTVVPGSRMWASLERGGLPLPDDLRVENFMDGALEGTLLGEFMEGNPEIQQIDNRDPVVSFGTSVARDLPRGLQDLWVGLWNKVLAEEMKLSLIPDRDFFGDPRITPAGHGPDFVTPFQFREEGDEDPTADELGRLGYGFSTKRRFGELYGVELTPEERDQFHRFFAKPTKDTMSIREHLEKVMIDEKTGRLSEDWLSLGDPYGENRGGKLALVDSIVADRMHTARMKMIEKWPERFQPAYGAQRAKGILSGSQEGVEIMKEAGDDTSKLLKALE